MFVNKKDLQSSNYYEFSKWVFPLTYTCDIGGPISDHLLGTNPRTIDSHDW